MNKLFCYLTMFLMLAAYGCTKNNGATSVQLNVSGTGDSLGVKLLSGVFKTGAEGNISGTANIYAGKTYNIAVLDSFMVSTGPDLHVYLATELPPVHFIDLGKLQSTTGRQNYLVKSKPDYLQYKYIVVHCQQYNVVFGSAELK